MLAHKAFREGKVAAEAVKGKPSAFDVRAIRHCLQQIPKLLIVA